MSGTSTLDPENFPERTPAAVPKGRDTRTLGPSDSSDSGSDMPGQGRDDDSDREGTGERMAAVPSRRLRPDSDRDADRVVSAAEAGLGDGLDQAEEAQLGITDEELRTGRDEVAKR
jgi:hypothetical protein